ncbi:MAG: hypothetical protein AB7N76_36305 [Planctomycetota bacterium]
MAKRRSDNPATILVLGMFIIAGFGACLVFLNEKTPVLQLRPEVAKQFQVDELKARFRVASPGSPAAIVLELPEDPGPQRCEEIADWSLRRYVELAKSSRAGRTTVAQCEIEIRGDARPRFVLRRAQLEARDAALAALDGLRLQLEQLGLQSPRVELGAYTLTGVTLRVEAEATGKERRPRLAQRALQLLERQVYAGEVRIELAGDPPLVLEGGREHRLPLPKRAPRRPTPGRRPPASHGAPPTSTSQGTAPVGS